MTLAMWIKQETGETVEAFRDRGIRTARGPQSTLTANFRDLEDSGCSQLQRSSNCKKYSQTWGEWQNISERTRFAHQETVAEN